MNPTAVMTDMGRCAYSDPARRVATLARTPQGKFAGDNTSTLLRNISFYCCAKYIEDFEDHANNASS